jgi:hypothetical protein
MLINMKFALKRGLSYVTQDDSCGQYLGSTPPRAAGFVSVGAR